MIPVIDVCSLKRLQSVSSRPAVLGECFQFFDDYKRHKKHRCGWKHNCPLCNEVHAVPYYCLAEMTYERLVVLRSSSRNAAQPREVEASPSKSFKRLSLDS